jgi:hypothetical protein
MNLNRAQESSMQYPSFEREREEYWEHEMRDQDNARVYKRICNTIICLLSVAYLPS